jgi:hypothetical protein
MRRIFSILVLFLAALAPAAPPELKLPLQANSVRFAVIGDSGTGQKGQYETAERMTEYHAAFPFDFVIMLGDNIYDGHAPADFKSKFEDPYRPLLDASVKFYASLGNHDDLNARLYKPFNMDGKRYYTFKRANAAFFALDSNYMDPEQLDWLDHALQDSNAAWKICFFHHPLYSHAKAHGSDLDLRKRIEPMLQARGVNVVWSGHDHNYERMKPQGGIVYFVLGNSGQLRFHDLRPSPDTAKGFDTDQSFGLVEIAGDKLYFQTVSRTGQTVDSGIVELAGKARSTAQ